MPDNPNCLSKHRQILAGRCPLCDRPIENGQVSTTLDCPAQIRWNWAAIEESLRDDDLTIRWQTAFELGDHATSLERALPLFVLALNDSDRQVRSIAEKACCQLGQETSRKQVAWLEAQRDDAETGLVSRVILLGKYFGKTRAATRACRATHIYWLIEHHPGREIAGSPEAFLFNFDRGAAYEPAKSLWLQQCEAHKSNPAVLGNAARFFTVNERELAEKFFLAAQSAEPTNPEWHLLLAHVHKLSAAHGPAELRSKRATQALVEFEMAEQIRSSHSGGAMPPFGVSLPEESQQCELLAQLHSLPERAKAACEAGEFKFARQFAEELLALSNSAELDEYFRSDGNAIHYSHLVLGRVAIHDGDIDRAKVHLLESGKTKGSPNLGSFGPNMSLAKELLELGQRDVVLEYLDLCGKFWERGSDRIDQWKDEITRGHIPAFGANLNY